MSEIGQRSKYSIIFKLNLDLQGTSDKIPILECSSLNNNVQAERIMISLIFSKVLLNIYVHTRTHKHARTYMIIDQVTQKITLV